MAKLKISESNALRFVNKTYYNSTLAMPCNRLYADYEYKNRLFYPYCQKFKTTDKIIVNFISDYSSFEAFLININTNTYTNITSGINLNGAFTNDLNYYTLTKELTGIAGYYRLELHAKQYAKPFIKFISEPIFINNDLQNHVKLSWHGNSTMIDGINWGTDYQTLWVEGQITKIEPSANKKTYDDSNYELITLRHDAILSYYLDLRLIPFYLTEIINNAIGHDTFCVNDIQFNTNETLNYENIKNTTLYKASLKLQIVDYENYYNIQELVGTPPVIEPVYRTTGDGRRSTGSGLRITTS